MAEISENYNVLPAFPQLVGEYKIKFSDEEEKIIQKWTDEDFIRENSLKADGGKDISMTADPYANPELRRNHAVFDDDFLILYVGMNLLYQEDWSSVRQAVEEVARHHVTQTLGFCIPSDCHIGVCDSWIIRTKNTNEYPTPYHRKHNHSFAWLTGVLYLDDSPNGTALCRTEPWGNDYLPFAWTTIENQHNRDTLDVPAEKGKIILFPAGMHHMIMNNADGSQRHTMPFNIFPFGNINNTNAAMLQYNGPLNLNVDYMGR